MKVELSNAEVELIDKALDTWEKEAVSSSIMGGVFAALISPKDDANGKEEFKKAREMECRKAEQETTRRRQQSILLRAKLIQAQNRQSEHEGAELEERRAV